MNAAGFRFAVVSSRWNDLLTDSLVEAAFDMLARLGAGEDAIEHFRVPGSFELPLAARKVADSKKFDAVICLGVIIRGETPHFDLIASATASGIMDAGISTGIPVLFGVVTADTVEQATNRCGVKAGNKGAEAAAAAVELVNLFKEVTGQKPEARSQNAE